tara:strand:+ start:328 stop:591 length:264 start_codon:yes stop_codon:yes gene_type:complete
MAKQKLSPEAAIAKARRDLRYANSRDREIKRADAQKKRRAAKKCGKNIDDKDYDHNTGRFTSVAHNRGGTQSTSRPDGTKQEKKQSK